MYVHMTKIVYIQIYEIMNINLKLYSNNVEKLG